MEQGQKYITWYDKHQKGQPERLSSWAIYAIDTTEEKERARGAMYRAGYTRLPIYQWDIYMGGLKTGKVFDLFSDGKERGK